MCVCVQVCVSVCQWLARILNLTGYSAENPAENPRSPCETKKKGGRVFETDRQSERGCDGGMEEGSEEGGREGGREERARVRAERGLGGRELLC